EGDRQQKQDRYAQSPGHLPLPSSAILADQPVVTTQLNDPVASHRRPDARRHAPASLPVQALVFAGATGLVLVYALRGGGSYDVVSFEEMGLVIWWTLAIGI